MGIADIYTRYGVFLFRLLFFTACPRVITLTSPLTAGVILSNVHDYRAFRSVQATFQTATA